MLETKFREDPLWYPVQNDNIWDLSTFTGVGKFYLDWYTHNQSDFFSQT